MGTKTEPRWNLAWKPASLETGDAVAELQLLAVLETRRQLQELARMRAVGMGWVERLQQVLDGRIDPTIDPVFYRSKGFVPDFVKIARAVRQIMVLQQELAGLRVARRRKLEDRDGAARSHGKRGSKRLVWRPLGPLPDDTKDFYDFRPVGEAVEWIRETLDIEAPADDPFREPEPCDATPEAANEPAAEPDVPEPDVPEPDIPDPVIPDPGVSEAEACLQPPAATEKRGSGRAYDLDFCDLTGEDLSITPDTGDATARGPP